MDSNKDNWQTWFKAALILIGLILLSAGFLLGYLYGDKEAIENPLVYGVNKLNEVNNDNFYCTCMSQSGRIDPFSFNGSQMIGKYS